ncbi:mechanosensitive channel protein [Enterobacterales bacterium]|nr:mechanosensitive channel protein [Enterobacterales bacterium]
MNDWIKTSYEWLSAYPGLLTFLALFALVIGAWLANWIVKRILLKGLFRIANTTLLGQSGQIQDKGVVNRLANIVPALVFSIGIEAIPGIPEKVVTVVENVAGAFIILCIGLAIGALLDIANTLYLRRANAYLKPIKGYLQVLKLVVYVLMSIMLVATLIDRSPLILLSGLGAMAAVLMLIFQDTLLSLVASVQISSNDIIRVGDWVEMPQLNTDGEVIDIALHTVTVQNWDKTISTIPTKRFISDSFKNWRGMQQAGGRRIKRSLHLDQNSVCFLTPEAESHIQRFTLLSPYMERKHSEITEWNTRLNDAEHHPVNMRRVTNLGSFRAYVEHYLRNSPHIHQEMTLIVRQEQPGPNGLPLELYCFTNTTAWNDYEGIQSDIFDHLLAIMPEFGLRVFQNPTGHDMREIGQTAAA